MGRTGRSNRARQRRAKEARALTEEVAARLREHVPPRRFWREHYGPDGEIEEAWEGRVLHPKEMIDRYVVYEHGFAEPKEDWRERGVTPPRGIHWATDQHEWPAWCDAGEKKQGGGTAVERESVERDGQNGRCADESGEPRMGADGTR